MWAMACQMSIHALDRELGVPTASAGPWQASLGPASGASHHAYGLGGLEANLNSGGATLTRARVRVPCACACSGEWRDHEQEWSPGRRVRGGGACVGDMVPRGCARTERSYSVGNNFRVAWMVFWFGRRLSNCFLQWSLALLVQIFGRLASPK